MISERQEKILYCLIKEYLDSAEPVASGFLKKRSGLSVSPATIRNELQELTGQGYVAQPHTSAGRVPTEKAYKHFTDTILAGNETPNFISEEIESARRKIEKELSLAKQLTEALTEISTTLSYARLENKDNIFEILKIIGPSQAIYDKNINLIKDLIRELENF